MNYSLTLDPITLNARLITVMVKAPTELLQFARIETTYPVRAEIANEIIELWRRLLDLRMRKPNQKRRHQIRQIQARLAAWERAGVVMGADEPDANECEGLS